MWLENFTACCHIICPQMCYMYMIKTVLFALSVYTSPFIIDTTQYCKMRKQKRYACIVEWRRGKKVAESFCSPLLPPTAKWGCSNTVKALDIGHSGSQEVEKGGPNYKKNCAHQLILLHVRHCRLPLKILN